MVTYSTAQFKYNAAHKVFGARRSSLPNWANPRDGFLLVSAASGATVRCLPVVEVIDANEKTLGWEFSTDKGFRVMVDNS